MFILDKPKAAEPTFVYLFLSCDDGRLKLSTRLKILPAQWSGDTERPIVTKDGKNKTAFLLLNRLHEAVDRTRDACMLNYEPFTKAKVEAAARGVLIGKEKKHLNFSQSVAFIVEKMKDGTLLTDKDKHYERGTIRNYNRIGRELFRFSKEKGISVEFAHTTIDTYNAVKGWCYAQGWGINYTGNIFKIWKGILKAGHKLGLHKNEVYRDTAFKIIAEQTEDIYLTLDEIAALQAVDCTHDKRWDTARDWFLIGCYSALRASDLKRITPAMIGKHSILIATEKTDEATEIPLHPVVRGILKKYKGTPPPMHENHINKYIKLVARKAGLTETFLYVSTIGGKRKEQYFEKWQMCSVHSARRSFITNARLLGMPDSLIMKLAAIRSAKTLSVYDKITTKQAAQQAAQHPFFSK